MSGHGDITLLLVDMINEDKLVQCGKTGILNPFMYFVVQINMSYKMEKSEGFSANCSLWKKNVF